MHNSQLRLGAILMLVSSAVGCGASEPPGTARERSVRVSQGLADHLAIIRRARVYFYHHSVGENILDGMRQLEGELGASSLTLVSTDDAAALDGPALIHGGGGTNGDPKSKIDFFAAAIRSQRALNPDLAILKLCYADFNPRTDVDDVFSHYRHTIDTLKLERPGVRFGHMTVPLMKHPAGLKATLYRWIGREVWEDASNVTRAHFNRLLLETFPSDPVFDLASVEATAPDGSLTTFAHSGRTYLSLYPGYTKDGGHLNPSGQRAAGAAAIRFLATALDRRRPGE